MDRATGIHSCPGTCTFRNQNASCGLTITAKSRDAARKELLDQAKAPDECEKLYEESLWCLYALRDDLLEGGKPFMEEDRKTISDCTSIPQSAL